MLLWTGGLLIMLSSGLILVVSPDSKRVVHKVFRSWTDDSEAEHETALLLGIFGSRIAAWRALWQARTHGGPARVKSRVFTEPVPLNTTWWAEGFATYVWLDES